MKQGNPTAVRLGLIRLDLTDDLFTHPRLQNLGNTDPAIRHLMVLHDGDDGSADRDRGAVQRVN